MEAALRMHAERTPNPDSIKWVLGEAIGEPGQSAHFERAPAGEVSPLAARLFAIEGVVGVFLAAKFVTVTRRPEAEWTTLSEPIVAALRECQAGGLAAFGPDFQPGDAADDDALAAQVRRILDDEVRPAVAMDGGDVDLVGVRDGIVELRMRGACSGCPSSAATLEHGIAARLRDRIPEIQGVVAV